MEQDFGAKQQFYNLHETCDKITFRCGTLNFLPRLKRTKTFTFLILPIESKSNSREEFHLGGAAPLPAHHEGGWAHDGARSRHHADAAAQAAAEAATDRTAGAGDGGPRPGGAGRPGVAVWPHVGVFVLSLCVTKDGAEGARVRLAALEEGDGRSGVGVRHRRLAGNPGKAAKGGNKTWISENLIERKRSSEKFSRSSGCQLAIGLVTFFSDKRIKC